MRKFKGEKIVMGKDFLDPMDISSIKVDIPLPESKKPSEEKISHYRRISRDFRLQGVTSLSSLKENDFKPPSFPSQKSEFPQRKHQSYSQYQSSGKLDFPEPPRRFTLDPALLSDEIKIPSKKTQPVKSPLQEQFSVSQQEAYSKPLPPVQAADFIPESSINREPPTDSKSSIYSLNSESKKSVTSLTTSLIEKYMNMESSLGVREDDASNSDDIYHRKPQSTSDDSSISLFSYVNSNSSANGLASSSSLDDLSAPIPLATFPVSKPLPDLPIESINQFEIRNYDLQHEKVEIIDKSTPPKLPIHHHMKVELQKKKSQMKKNLEVEIPKDTSVFTRTPTRIRKVYGKMPVMESRENKIEEKQRSTSLQYLQKAGIEPFMLGGYQETNKLKVIN
ncbi:hypothetical protein CANARDRAFT_28118 [[Candida] arabinofermentans NRRL YB-2248]|uniref:Uncharacterized protein n=1 Tax=[Candida] arabinofermentans NRRL YB-2248 TaxID=983967 RepID=A0A1E4T2T8_9ASCO|nr:hypothetical protein CANARDRAFT_28118 [[Candida] arabinofermentans NRRL YB-2248]